jgi:hypothetical protein
MLLMVRSMSAPKRSMVVKLLRWRSVFQDDLYYSTFYYKKQFHNEQLTRLARKLI